MSHEAKPPLPSGLQLTELNPAFREDPHATLSSLREAEPVRRDPVFVAFYLTRYDDIRGVLTDRTLLKDGNKAEEAAVFARRLQAPPPGLESEGSPAVILFLDDPDHKRVRTPLMK